MTRDLTVLHEAAISLTTNPESGPKVSAVLGIGNTPQTFGSISGETTPAFRAANPNFRERGDDFWVNELKVSFDHSLLGQNFSAVVGRFGHQSVASIFKRPDRTPYYDNAFWDNGNWNLDGAALMFNFGGVKTNVFGGNLNMMTTNGVPAQVANITLAGAAGASPINRVFGIDATLGLGGENSLKLAAIQGDSDTISAGGFNRVESLGAELKYNVGGIRLGGSYGLTAVKLSDTNVNANDHTAWDVNAGFKVSGVDLMAGYKQVDPRFVAALSSLGRFGTQFSPTGYKGFYGKVGFGAGPATIYAKGGFFEGVTAGAITGNLGLAAGQEASTYTVGAKLRLADMFDLDASYENAQWEAPGADPYQRWYTLGFNWGMAEGAKFRLFYQYSDANGQGGAFAGYGLQDRYTGGLLGTQISIKF
ncbi:MAG: hypothetical protein MH204_07370, partial [Fimbriimonadaceae bacterium]|nr:hypothetical protein [Fimbriimonadaceae bacterium]